MHDLHLTKIGESLGISIALRRSTLVVSQRLLAVMGMCFLFLSSALAAPIHDAARKGDVDGVKQLLDGGGGGLEERDATGETPLISASLAGKTRIVELLLARGAMMEARNNRGLTPLHAAAYGGHLGVAIALIDHGAKVDDAENRYKTTALIIAAEEGHADIVKLLIDKGAKLEMTEVNGFTALTQAGGFWHWEAVTVLIQAGAACQRKEIVGDWWWAECNRRRK